MHGSTWYFCADNLSGLRAAGVGRPAGGATHPEGQKIAREKKAENTPLTPTNTCNTLWSVKSVLEFRQVPTKAEGEPVPPGTRPAGPSLSKQRCLPWMPSTAKRKVRRMALVAPVQRGHIWTSGPPSAQKLLDPCHPAVRAPLELAPSRDHSRTHPLIGPAKTRNCDSKFQKNARDRAL